MGQGPIGSGPRPGVAAGAHPGWGKQQGGWGKRPPEVEDWRLPWPQAWVLSPWALGLGPWPLVVYYYIITTLFYIITILFQDSTSS